MTMGGPARGDSDDGFHIVICGKQKARRAYNPRHIEVR